MIYWIALLLFVCNSLLFVIFIATKYYAPMLVMIHLFSLLLLIGYVFVKVKIFQLLKMKFKEVLFIMLFVAASIGIGLYQLEVITPGMYGDEVTVGRKSLELLQKPGWPPFDGIYSHPTPLLYLTAASINTFGHTMTAIRLPSILFGALAVGAFFVLLRQFFPVPIAAVGSTLLLFQYTHIILYRLAYEPPASLFFQIITVLCFVLYWKTKKPFYLVAIALGIGAGLYTYLNYRIFAIVLFLFTSISLIKSYHGSARWLYLLLFSVCVFIAMMPLFSYAIIDPHGFWLRPAEISIFGRGYPPDEFIKEVLGNITRTVGFPFIGDPNPDKNPSGVTLFDPLTMLLALGGLIALFKRNRNLFWFSLILLIPPILSDIFSTEVIPEFHYYGLGHPNVLRVSGFIWVVIFLATYAFWWIYNKWYKQNKAETCTAIIAVLVIISIWNLVLYFNQKSIKPQFYIYNYEVNHQEIIDALKAINQQPGKKVAMTKAIQQFEYVPFFLAHEKKLTILDYVSTKSAEEALAKHDIIAIDVTNETLPVLQSLAQDNDIDKTNYTANIIVNPLNQPKIVLFEELSNL